MMSIGELSDQHQAKLRRQCRVLLLLDAAEQVGITPLLSARLHAFAYLADVLSPVWGLSPFDGKVYKSDGGPRYTDLQEEIDSLVVLGLVSVWNLGYEKRPDKGARITGSYGLNFDSDHLEKILGILGARLPDQAIIDADCNLHRFLVELAGALATLPDDQIELSTAVDATYRVPAQLNDVVDFAEWTASGWDSNPTWRLTERFQKFLPEETKLRSGEKLYLYAAYLGRAIHGV